MKKILSVVVAGAALALSLSSGRAQSYYGPVPLLNGTTSNYALATTNTVNSEMDVRQSETLGIQLSYRLTGAGTSNIVFNLQKSLDRVNYEPATPSTITLAANGTNTVSIVTNYAVGAVGFYRLSTVHNTATNAMTNVYFIYTTKRL